MCSMINRPSESLIARRAPRDGCHRQPRWEEALRQSYSPLLTTQLCRLAEIVRLHLVYYEISGGSDGWKLSTLNFLLISHTVPPFSVPTFTRLPSTLLLSFIRYNVYISQTLRSYSCFYCTVTYSLSRQSRILNRIFKFIFQKFKKCS